MVLVTKKTTKLVGELKVEDKLIKQITVDIDEIGVSTVSEYTYDQQAYADNRKEMRKQEQEFRNKRYELEDAILTEQEQA